MVIQPASRNILHQATYPMQNKSDDNFAGFDGGPMEKDENEIELEKLVFGDEEGFQNDLSVHREGHGPSYTHAIQATQREDQGELDEARIIALDDADLFFLDSGQSTINTATAFRTKICNGEGTDPEDQDSAVWVDSDDERLTVSLASNPRLRKLRIEESEDLINGKEYISRLRRQFERLYPRPDWANPTTHSSHNKRRRISNSSNSSDSSEAITSGDDMSHGSEELSTQPLAKILQNAGNLVQPTQASAIQKKRLRPDTIDVQRTKDVGTAQPSSVASLAFHPTHPLLLSSGPSSTLSLHHISPHPPNPNPLLTALHLRSTSLTTSLFLPPSGNKIYFSGRRRYFHIWDLKTGRIEKVSRIIGHGEVQRSMERLKLSPCGRWMGLVGSGRKGGGVINILDTNTCQWIAEVRVEGNGGVADFAWWGDGEGMLLVGKGGEAIEWDGRQKRVIARWVDEGAVGTTVVVVGGKGTGPKDIGGNRWVAVGSSSGIVNVYDRRKWMNAKSIHARPKPVRAFDQLTTPVSHLEFSPDGQILCMASRWKRDALRLVHLPSCTVYRNWPTSSTPLGRVTAVAWSPNSEMLAVSNEQGKIRLWEIRS